MDCSPTTDHRTTHHMAASSVTLNAQLRLSESVPRTDDSVVYRHITRFPHGRIAEQNTFFAEGASRQLTWPDVYICIVAAAKSELVRLDMVDTCQLERLEVKSYCYTDAQGTSLLKGGAQTLNTIYDQFTRIGRAIHAAGETKNAAVCYKFGSSVPVVLDNDAFEAFCYQTVTAPSFSTEVQLVQVFVPSKGYPDQHRTYRTHYWLDKVSSVPAMRSERVDVSRTVTGSAGISTTTHMSRLDNIAMETNVFEVRVRCPLLYRCNVAHVRGAGLLCGDVPTDFRAVPWCGFHLPCACASCRWCGWWRRSSTAAWRPPPSTLCRTIAAASGCSPRPNAPSSSARRPRP